MGFWATYYVVSNLLFKSLEPDGLVKYQAGPNTAPSLRRARNPLAIVSMRTAARPADALGTCKEFKQLVLVTQP